MLLCLPLELLAYLGAHRILPLERTKQRKLAMLSGRMWLFYLLLQCMHLVEDSRLCRIQAQALERARGHPVPLPALSRRSSYTSVGKSDTTPYEFYTRADESKPKASRLHGIAKRAAQRSKLTKESFEEYADDPKAAERAITRALWDQLDDRKHDILVSLWLSLCTLPLALWWALAVPSGRRPGEAPGTYRPSTFTGLAQGTLGSLTAFLSFRRGWNVTAAIRPSTTNSLATYAEKYGYHLHDLASPLSPFDPLSSDPLGSQPVFSYASFPANS